MKRSSFFKADLAKAVLQMLSVAARLSSSVIKTNSQVVTTKANSFRIISALFSSYHLKKWLDVWGDSES